MEVAQKKGIKVIGLVAWLILGLAWSRSELIVGINWFVSLIFWKFLVERENESF